ncbi:hypothetical protein [Dermabacter hominis]|mgnify:CR=1 FL=1
MSEIAEMSARLSITVATDTEVSEVASGSFPIPVGSEIRGDGVHMFIEDGAIADSLACALRSIADEITKESA